MSDTATPNIKTARNGDIMGHVMKGGIGIRLDFVNKLTLEKCTIDTITNHSPLGINNEILGGYLDSKTENNKENHHHRLNNLDDEMPLTADKSDLVDLENRIMEKLRDMI